MFLHTFPVHWLFHWLISWQSTMQPHTPAFGQSCYTALRSRNRDIWRILKLSCVGQLVEHPLRNLEARLPFDFLVNNLYELFDMLDHLVMRLLQCRELLFLFQS